MSSFDNPNVLIIRNKEFSNEVECARWGALLSIDSFAIIVFDGEC